MLELAPELRHALGSDISASVLDHVSSPLFLEFPSNLTSQDVTQRVRASAPALDSLILQHGGVVLRNTGLSGPADFDAFIGAFPAYERGYVGGAGPRSLVTGQVWEATKVDQRYKITVHQEMAYMADFPPRIAFYCARAAESGGETIVARMSEFMKRIPSELMHELAAHGVRSVRNYARAHEADGKSTVQHIDEKSWDEVFGTDDRGAVEAICAERNIECIWNDDGTLTLVEYMSAFTKHPILDKEFYRNIVHINFAQTELGSANVEHQERVARQKMRTGLSLGSGEELSAEQFGVMERALDEVTLAWDWRAGDVMVLDNLQMGHGRNPFEGERETFVALLGAPAYSVEEVASLTDDLKCGAQA